MTFFTILGIITFFFVCKFIYDSYFTNYTERRYEEFKRQNPYDNEVIRINKREAELKFIDGYHKWKKGEHMEAFVRFQEAHELDPSNEEIKKVYQETASFILSGGKDSSNGRGPNGLSNSLAHVTEEA